MKSIHSKLSTFKQFQTDFSNKKKQGFDLIDLKYGTEGFIAAYGNNIGKSDFRVSQTIWDTSSSISDLKKTVTANKAKGYELTDLDYDGGWFSIYASGEGDSKLIEADTYPDIKKQLLDLQDLDSSISKEYYIADIEYAKGDWYAVANYAAGDATYTRSETFTEFKREILRQSNLGLELANLEYAEGDYIGIYVGADISGDSKYSSKFHADIDDFTVEIKANRDRGYDLINTETINGSWFGIYKQDADFGKPLTSASGTEPVFDPVQDTLSKVTSTFGLFP